MNRLVFSEGTFERFRADMLSSELETAALVLARAVRTPNGDWRLLVAGTCVAPADAYAERTREAAILKPEFVAEWVKHARARSLSVVLAHTHPWDGDVAPSPIDIAGEAAVLPFLHRRVPSVPHGALVIGRKGHHCRIFLPENREAGMEVFSVGPSFRHVPARTEHDTGIAPAFDRQVRAFGSAGQHRVASVRVGIVGLGGTGSVVAQQLAHLGVRDFVLIDPDLLEETNLNRVVGAQQTDVARPKVEVAADMIRRIRPSAQTTALQASVLHNVIAKTLCDSDVFFCCTDSHGSRAVLTQLAYQYFVPCFDIGVRIDATSGSVSHITGRVQMLSPGLACLACAELLDPEMVRQDLMSESERRADPYIVGHTEVQPAVISINSVVASLAVTMFLGAVAGIPTRARHQIYRAEQGVVRSIENEPSPKCVVCSESGTLGAGDTWVLPGRVD